MHSTLVNRVVFPLHERLKGKATHAKLAELERTQWLTPAALRSLQLERLRRHLEWAYREVPYYGRLLDDHGLPPAAHTVLRGLCAHPAIDQGHPARAPGRSPAAHAAPRRAAAQHRRLHRRARHGAGRPRAVGLHRRRPAARSPLVRGRHGRARDRPLGLAHRARAAGPAALGPRLAAQFAAPVRLRPRRGGPGALRRGGARRTGPRSSTGMRAPWRCSPATSRAPGAFPPGGRRGPFSPPPSPSTTSSAPRSAPPSAARSPPSTGAATGGWWRSNVRRAGSTSPRRACTWRCCRHRARRDGRRADPHQSRVLCAAHHPLPERGRRGPRSSIRAACGRGSAAAGPCRGPPHRLPGDALGQAHARPRGDLRPARAPRAPRVPGGPGGARPRAGPRGADGELSAAARARHRRPAWAASSRAAPRIEVEVAVDLGGGRVREASLRHLARGGRARRARCWGRPEMDTSCCPPDGIALASPRSQRWLLAAGVAVGDPRPVTNWIFAAGMVGLAVETGGRLRAGLRHLAGGRPVCFWLRVHEAAALGPRLMPWGCFVASLFAPAGRPLAASAAARRGRRQLASWVGGGGGRR